MAKAGRSTSWLALSSLFLLLAFPAAAPPAYAGDNPHFTIPLHAKASNFEPCNGYLPVDCLVGRPTVEVPSGQPVAIFVFVMNYTKLGGVQTAFEVDRSWTFAFGLWECHGLYELPPHPPFGPTAGTISLAFNQCATSGALEVLGRMFFISGIGCVGQVQSSYPSGICTWNCDGGEIDRILPGEEARLGRVCAGPGGRDACDRLVPVDPSTWGLIKATYR